MNFFKRRSKKPPPEPVNLGSVDMTVARQVAELVNQGDLDGADALCATTPSPRSTAFAAFRWID
jgi:hypothetical protein